MQGDVGNHCVFGRTVRTVEVNLGLTMDLLPTFLGPVRELITHSNCGFDTPMHPTLPVYLPVLCLPVPLPLVTPAHHPPVLPVPRVSLELSSPPRFSPSSSFAPPPDSNP